MKIIIRENNRLEPLFEGEFGDDFRSVCLVEETRLCKCGEKAFVFTLQRTRETPGVTANIDNRKIEHARQLVAANLREPYSLLELARRTGLNDFKLKKGFKLATGMTVFAYLNELRMERALALLRDEKKPVSAVSHEVGYRNPHHFTAAFKKKFGVLPREISRGL